MTDYSEADVHLFSLLGHALQAVFKPSSFIQAEEEHAAIVNRLGPGDNSPGARLRTLRRAMWWSFLICFGSCVVAILVALIWTPTGLTAATLVVAGSVLILWATLAVRGWDIQSIKGVTLTEQVNQLIFRGSYCIGTFLIVLGTIGVVL